MTTGVEPEGSASGGPAEGEEEPGPSYEPVGRMTLKSPAVIVVVIALVILAAGITASVLATGGSSNLTLRSVTLADGTVVHVQPAARALKPIEANGNPPADVLAALAVPVGSQTTGTLNTDQNTAQYDRTVDFTSTMTADQVQNFFEIIFKRLRWKVIATGPDAYQAGSTEVLAKKGSTNGYYWEAGVVVSPTTDSGVTPFTLRLFEVPDTT